MIMHLWQGRMDGFQKFFLEKDLCEKSEEKNRQESGFVIEKLRRVFSKFVFSNGFG